MTVALQVSAVQEPAGVDIDWLLVPQVEMSVRAGGPFHRFRSPACKQFVFGCSAPDTCSPCRQLDTCNQSVEVRLDGLQVAAADATDRRGEEGAVVLAEEPCAPRVEADPQQAEQTGPPAVQVRFSSSKRLEQELLTF